MVINMLCFVFIYTYIYIMSIFTIIRNDGLVTKGSATMQIVTQLGTWSLLLTSGYEGARKGA